MYQKMIAAVLAVLLLIGCLPVTANATEAEQGSKLLTGTVQQQLLTSPAEDACTTVESAAAVLRAGMVNRQEQIRISYQYAYDVLDESGQIVLDLMDQIYYEAIRHTGNPKEGDYIYQCLYSLTPDGTFSYENGTYFINMVYTASYFTTAQQEAEVDAKVAELVESLQLRAAMSDYRKLQNIYGYMCGIKYDEENLHNSEYLLKHSAYAALIHGTAVCQGFAALLYRLVLEAGIDCRVIIGNSVNPTGGSERHAWNIVKLRDHYYYVDSTWDSICLPYLGMCYFLKGQQTFQDHQPDAVYTTAEFTSCYPIPQEDYVYSGEDSFNESDFVYEIVNGEAHLTGYTGTQAFVQIPEQLGGHPLTVIEEKAFWSNQYVQTVQLPKSVVLIEDGWCDVPDPVGAFACCPLLKEVIVPEGSQLRRMGNYTFSGSGLEKINLPEGLSEIGGWCFAECTSLTELKLPNSLCDLGQNALMDSAVKTLHIPANTFVSLFFDQNLESFTVDENHPTYREEDGVLYSNFAPTGAYDGWTLMHYPGNKPDTEFRVADFCTHIWGDVLPKKLETLYIGDCNAAEGAGGGISLSRARCRVVPDETNPYFTSYREMLFTKDMKTLVQVPSYITETVVIPEGVERVEKYALEHGQYKTVILPESMQSIGSAAFWQTPTLERIYIPGGLTEFTGSSVFQDCYRLTYVYFGGTGEQWESLFNPTDVAFPPSYLAPYFHLHAGSTATVVPASCTSPGNVTVSCGECDSSFTEVLPAHSHNFSSSLIFDAATQTHSKVCLDCAEKETGPCSMDEGTVLVPATPKKSGVKEFTCSVCNGSYQQAYTDDLTPMYRLYNPNSGEHFYTGSVVERDMLRNAGWNYEGIAWNAPTATGTPVHRLFNPNNGDHHYTMSQDEVDMLVSVGWIYEGVSWNSASDDNVPQYRLYNPNADCGSHHYTSSTEERDFLVSLGWIFEGVGWFGIQ